MQRVDVSCLLLVRRDQRLQVWPSLRLHILPHEDRAGLPPSALHLEGGADHGDAHLRLVHVRDGIGIALLKPAHELLRVAGWRARVR